MYLISNLVSPSNPYSDAWGIHFFNSKPGDVSLTKLYLGAYDEKGEEIIKLLSTFDWKEYLNCIAMRKIQQFHIVDVLKNNVDGIE